MVEWHELTSSTMILAATRAKAGAPHGAIIGAEQQTAGIGRHGKGWHSAPGEGLYVSIILRLGLAANRLPVLMLALGLAAREAVQKVASLDADLRWPNDILVKGKKLAGMLAQVEGDAIIAGIGINVSQQEFPKDLETPGTSLALENAPVKREDLLVALAEAVDRHCELLTQEGPEPILHTFADASSYVSGLRVRADAEGRQIEGVTCGLDEAGFLRVREDSGRIVTILAGGVRPVK